MVKKKIFIVALIFNLFAISGMAKENFNGQFACRPQLIGYWQVVQPSPEMSKHYQFNLGSMPYQWFAFYDDGKMISIKCNDPLRKVTPKDLDNFLNNHPDKVGAFTFEYAFATISDSNTNNLKSLWGVNVINSKFTIGSVDHNPGDIIMSLDANGQVLFYRHLRRLILSEYDYGKNSSAIKSTPLVSKNGQTISAAEREIIRVLIPYFTSMNDKDTATMKKFFPLLNKQSDNQLRLNLAKNYILHGLEDVSYDGSRLRAVALYSFETKKSDSLAKNIALMSADVHIALENGKWIIVGWFQNDKNLTDNEYFQNILFRQEKAEKRYGTTDIAKWNGL